MKQREQDKTGETMIDQGKDLNRNREVKGRRKEFVEQYMQLRMNGKDMIDENVVYRAT